MSLVITSCLQLTEGIHNTNLYSQKINYLLHQMCVLVLCIMKHLRNRLLDIKYR